MTIILVDEYFFASYFLVSTRQRITKNYLSSSSNIIDNDIIQVLH